MRHHHISRPTHASFSQPQPTLAQLGPRPSSPLAWPLLYCADDDRAPGRDGVVTHRDLQLHGRRVKAESALDSCAGERAVGAHVGAFLLWMG